MQNVIASTVFFIKWKSRPTPQNELFLFYYNAMQETTQADDNASTSETVDEQR